MIVFKTNDTPGIRTRVLLLASLVLLIAGSTSTSLLIIRNRLQHQAQDNFSADLHRSFDTFLTLQSQRRTGLRRANALLADLPSLKALMTTHDERTIADGSILFWKTSGNDLFALADRDFNIMALDTRASSPQLNTTLKAQLADTSNHFLLGNADLYEYAVQPIYFGDRVGGTLLGYVISGYSINQVLLHDVANSADSDAAFFADNRLLSSSLPTEKQPLLAAAFSSIATSGELKPVVLGNERYLATSLDLHAGDTLPLRLVVMKSFLQTEQASRQINRLISVGGLIALGIGATLMILLSRMLTAPIERLAKGVHAFGSGDPQFSLPADGTQEVQYLSKVFADMRDQIQKANSKLLEAERLATIGRIASSVSHDLRHYLAAIYANAEFLASPNLALSERQELYEEIRLAVQGTTDMLDSLLLFGRTGSALHRSPTPVLGVVERAITLVRSHPDSDGILVSVRNHADDTTANIDSRQMERAIYNLLLNACQSASQTSGKREVSLTLTASQQTVTTTIVDTGAGVPDSIRDSLFAPFVSQGRQKGTGLGLTLASSVAREHNGEVRLLDGRAGSTTFSLTIARNLPQLTSQAASSSDGAFTR